MRKARVGLCPDSTDNHGADKADCPGCPREPERRPDCCSHLACAQIAAIFNGIGQKQPASSNCSVTLPSDGDTQTLS